LIELYNKNRIILTVKTWLAPGMVQIGGYLLERMLDGANELANDLYRLGGAK
jgi:hypothetical protein